MCKLKNCLCPAWFDKELEAGYSQVLTDRVQMDVEVEQGRRRTIDWIGRELGLVD